LRVWWDKGGLVPEEAVRIVQKSPGEVQEKRDDLKRRNFQSKRIEWSGKFSSSAIITGSFAVLSPSRITHEARKGKEEELLASVEKRGSIPREEAASSCQIRFD